MENTKLNTPSGISSSQKIIRRSPTNSDSISDGINHRKIRRTGIKVQTFSDGEKIPTENSFVEILSPFDKKFSLLKIK